MPSACYAGPEVGCQSNRTKPVRVRRKRPKRSEQRRSDAAHEVEARSDDELAGLGSCTWYLHESNGQCERARCVAFGQGDGGAPCALRGADQQELDEINRNPALMRNRLTDGHLLTTKQRNNAHETQRKNAANKTRHCENKNENENENEKGQVMQSLLQANKV